MAVRAAENSHMLLLYKRVLEGKTELIPLFFAAGVLEKYRGQSSFGITRTDTIGRVKRQGGWALDFGITAGDEFIHVSLGDFSTKLPEADREHWLEYLVSLPYAPKFIKSRVAAACLDDGDFRTW